ncbi:MAG TPA: pirin family protein [Bacteroidia bacterium]|nr:pirin family protein [Bacteroidia bacterium]
MSKRKISYKTNGHRADIGSYVIYRMVSNNYVESVGPFVFLDHIVPIKHSPDEDRKVVNGTGAHPHRGIATLTYLLNGEADHNDSRGHRALVRSGGAQWMKAGNGIIHDEVVNVDPETNNLITHGFQFWVNLPAKNKAELPQYLPVQASEIPVKKLNDNAGWLKVVAGEYEGLTSKIPAYLKQFIFHIHLEAGKSFTLETDKDQEYAALIALGKVAINDTESVANELVGLDNGKGTIDIQNKTDETADIILFGGEPYTEPIVAAGPFVMNTEHEISQAYNDFYNGKYGEIKYEKSSNHK